MIMSPEAIQLLLPICAVVAGNNMTATSERQQSRRLFLPIEIDHKARGSPEYSSTTALLRQHLCYFGHADVERDMIVQQTGMHGRVNVDRKRVVLGKSLSVRLHLGVGRIN